MRAGDRRAREELIALHLPLARALALRYRRSSEPAEDLVQVAALGLVKAVDRWDADRGVELSTYATPTILGELRRHFRDHTWAVRPPRRLQELSLATDRASETLWRELGRTPTAAELARRVGCDEPALRDAQLASAGRWPTSLDAPAFRASDDAMSFGEALPSRDRELDRAEDRVTAERLVRILDERSQEILRLRYQEDLQQADIATRIGSSQVQVSRALRASLEKLQAYAEAAVRRPGQAAA